MKTAILYITCVITMLQMCTIAATAQNRIITPEGTITVTQFEQKQDMLYVKFYLDMSNVEIKSKQQLSYTPTISSLNKSVSMPKVLLRGRNNNKVYVRSIAIMSKSQRAYNMSRSQTYADIKAFGDGEKYLNYSYSIPYEDWMSNARLLMETSISSNGRESDRNSTILANITTEPVVVVEEIVPVAVAVVEPVFATTPKEIATPSITEAILAKYPFTSHISEYRNDMKIIDTPNGAEFLKIYFESGNTKIDGNYMRNSENLRSLRNAINELQNLDQYKIEKVFILGFGSTDGIHNVNELLSLKRTESINNYIYNNTRISESSIEIYNGLENWSGLRNMVIGSNMMDKAVVLYIIDNTYTHEEVTRQLKALDNGKTYKYIENYFFPKLRCGYVKVYFSDRK